ncbi:hypothetical protein [Amycolatopsis albispora]|uniref:Uncharacterized protein n=1 Tax=Amycolatopsis albispora TaxID=1804986 RepID=A0A344L0Y6_9PSEU|nr:hypothetical protein [Amycolatopsis albispora]AXB41710.1 hypothetical protein A4R43_03570 [Amycolatopsis albispora]
MHGSKAWRIVPELTRGRGADPKHYGDSFEATELEQVIAHTNLYRAYQTAPGRKAAAVSAKEVDFTSP